MTTDIFSRINALQAIPVAQRDTGIVASILQELSYSSIDDRDHYYQLLLTPPHTTRDDLAAYQHSIARATISINVKLRASEALLDTSMQITDPQKRASYQETVVVHSMKGSQLKQAACRALLDTSMQITDLQERAQYQNTVALCSPSDNSLKQAAKDAHAATLAQIEPPIPVAPLTPDHSAPLAAILGKETTPPTATVPPAPPAGPTASL